MSDLKWKLNPNRLKRYPHFDGDISISDAEMLVNDPERVAKHMFYPFIMVVKQWRQYAKNGEKRELKTRPIRYAARADAYIFSKYRHQLSCHYEKMLADLDLSQNIVAYRRIPVGLKKGGKCNIHFAKEVFDEIKSQGECCAIALDISKFFESLDHQILKKQWCRLLNSEKLPPDHFAVFKAITKYSIVDKINLYERLGHYGFTPTLPGKKPQKGYLTPKNLIPRQLCLGRVFREKIAGGNEQKNLIEMNFEEFGIPQGSPISDLLANIYLLDFDIYIKNYVKSFNGFYMRYSDDIMVIAPVSSAKSLEIEKHIRTEVKKFGAKIQIKETKSAILRFWRNASNQNFEVVFDGQRNKGRKTLNGIDYLGFRFNGKNVYIRDSTLANLWRKISRTCRQAAISNVKRFRNLDGAIIKKTFDYDRIVKKFGRVESFEEISGEFKSWTFWTYALRSAEIFGPPGLPIIRQLKNHRAKIKKRVDQEIDIAVSRRVKR